MKKIYYSLACCLIGGMLASCGGGAKKSNATEEAAAPTTTAVSYSKSLKAPETDSLNLPIDADGYITIFDGKSLDGWRGYGKDKVPSRWIIEDGCLKFCGTGTGEGQTGEGGDLIFAHKFKNFELELEWKISKGGNSGIFYLAQEVTSKDKDGNEVLEPIYISAPEFQVLDNANHPDAKLGKDNNRQAASLYDMIPAVPQNAKPFGEWNKAKIMVYKGTVVHGQNDENVLEYHLSLIHICALPGNGAARGTGNELPQATGIKRLARKRNKETGDTIQDAARFLVLWVSVISSTRLFRSV